MVNNAAFDTAGDPTAGPSGAEHADRIAAASGSQQLPTKDDPSGQQSASRPPSRNSASIHNGPNFLARSRSPPQAASAYMMSTADGMTVPLPQPSSQRSQRSDRPTPSEGDLREYSTANAVPIAVASQALRWRTHAGSVGTPSIGMHVGSPSRSSIPSRRGGGLHRVSHSNASFCGSVDSRSTYAAGWVGAPPAQNAESIYTADGRASMDNSRQLASVSQRGVRPGAAHPSSPAPSQRGIRPGAPHASSPAPSPQVSADPPPVPQAVAAAAAAKVLDSADVVNGSKSISFGVTKLQQASSTTGLSSIVAPRAGPSGRGHLSPAHPGLAAQPAANSPLPGSAAQLLKEDVKPVSVRGSESVTSSTHARKTGPSEEKAAQYAAIHAAREQGNWKPGRF